MKKISILLMLIFSFLLSSCIKTNTIATIDKNFDINEKTVMDFTKINEMSNGMQGLSESGSKVKTPCENFWEQEKKSEDELKKGDKRVIYGYKKVECKDLDENKGLVSMNGGNVKKYIIKKDNTFIFDLNAGLGGSEKPKDKEYSEEQREQSIQMLKGWGVEINYQFKFPGKIISSDYGKFKGNTLYLTIYDIMKSEKKNPVLVFKDEGDIKVETLKIVNKLASKLALTKQLIIAKKDLAGNGKMQKLIKKIDVLIPRMNKEKLQGLYDKLSKYDLKNAKYKNIKNIVLYIRARTGLELYKKQS